MHGRCCSQMELIGSRYIPNNPVINRLDLKLVPQGAFFMRRNLFTFYAGEEGLAEKAKNIAIWQRRNKRSATKRNGALQILSIFKSIAENGTLTMQSTYINIASNGLLPMRSMYVSTASNGSERTPIKSEHSDRDTEHARH